MGSDFHHLYPLLLLPFVVWVAFRYLPLLDGAGRPRVYLLLSVCAGLLTVQMASIHRDAYPLHTWTMYSSPDPAPVAWDFHLLDADGERHVPWPKVVPIASVRAFQRKLENLAASMVAEQDSSRRAEREAQLAAALRRLAEPLYRKDPHPALRAIRVRRCELDPHAFTSRPEVDRCEVVLLVEGTAAGAP